MPHSRKIKYRNNEGLKDGYLQNHIELEPLGNAFKRCQALITDRGDINE
jgi:hypothetical protein